MDETPDTPEVGSTTAAPSLLGAAEPVVVERRRRVRRGNAGADGGDDGGTRSHTGRNVVVVALVILCLALVPTVASGMEKTPRDRVGISYGGGPIEGSHFQRIVQPGSNLFWNGVFDSLYLYPADQQNYIISKSETEGTQTSDSITAPTLDRVQAEFQVAVYFKLNTDLLQKFHEELGLRYNASTDAGWDRLINDTFRQQIENAIQEETRRASVSELYGNADLLVEIQERIQTTLSQRLTAALGDQFFCAPDYRPGEQCGDPTFVVKSIGIPESVARAFEANRTSLAEVQTRKNEVEQRQAEAEAIKAISDALAVAGDDYVLLKAIESGKISFWVLPNDSGINLTPPPTDASGTTTTTPDGG